jgi:formate transporter
LSAYPSIRIFLLARFEIAYGEMMLRAADMYFIPIALFIKDFAPEGFWHTIGKTAADYPNLTWYNFFVGNLLPVTLGNIIGGAVLVRAVYWFVYLRKQPSA